MGRQRLERVCRYCRKRFDPASPRYRVNYHEHYVCLLNPSRKTYRCVPCGVSCKDHTGRRKHLASRKHLECIRRLGIDVETAALMMDGGDDSHDERRSISPIRAVHSEEEDEDEDEDEDAGVPRSPTRAERRGSSSSSVLHSSHTDGHVPASPLTSQQQHADAAMALYLLQFNSASSKASNSAVV